MVDCEISENSLKNQTEKKNLRREEISFFAKGVKSSETIDNGRNLNGLENHNLEQKNEMLRFFFQPIVKV